MEELYFLQKKVYNVPGRIVISNCVPPTEKKFRALGLPLETYNAFGKIVHERHQWHLGKSQRT